MYLSLNPTVVADRVPWPDLARLAAKVGFPGVDLDLLPAMKQGLPAMRSLFSDLKIRPAAAVLPVEFRKDDTAFRKDLEKLGDAAAFSAAVDCSRMFTYILPSSETPKAELRVIYLKRFRAVADVLARSHVRLGLEFLGPLHLRKMYPHEFIWRMNDMLTFAKECGSNVGLQLDVWHWHHAGATTADIIHAGRERIVHVHLSDAPNLPADQIRDDERLMPGEGVIDLVSFFHALQEIGYRDFVSVEVFGRGLKNMPPEEGARLALDSARAVMRKAGVA